MCLEPVMIHLTISLVEKSKVSFNLLMFPNLEIY